MSIAPTFLPNAQFNALLIDCSTIDVSSAREVARDALSAGFSSCRCAGQWVALRRRKAGRSRSWWGAREQDFCRRRGRAGAHGESGDPRRSRRCGAGGEDLQQYVARHFDDWRVRRRSPWPSGLNSIRNASSTLRRKHRGQCWSLTNYCPWPGPVPNAPSNRDYEGGFASAMMLKDLGLAQDAAQNVNANTPLGGAGGSALRGIRRTRFSRARISPRFWKCCAGGFSAESIPSPRGEGCRPKDDGWGDGAETGKHIGFSPPRQRYALTPSPRGEG